jgi:peptide/nickel transport system substrate-binding protein
MDRQGIVDEIFYGQSPVIDTYIPHQHPLYNSDIMRYEFDIGAGSALLEEVGWVDDDGDPTTARVAENVERVPDGTQFKIAFEGANAINVQRVMSYIEQTLSLCGIQLEVKFFPRSEWYADGPEGRLFGRDFELSALGWLTGAQPPCDLYLSTQTPGPGGESMISIMTGEEVVFQSAWGGQNNSGFVNEEYDKACNAALNALPGQPEYVAAHLEAQRIFAEQLPVVPLYLPTKLAATRPDMCNFIMDPTMNSEFWNIEEFDYGEGCEE